MKVAFGLIFVLMLGSASLTAQHKFPSLSPLGTVNQRVGNTLVTFPVETNTNREMMNYIDNQLLPGKETAADQYNDAADHLRMMRLRWEDAYTLTNMALERNGNRGYSRSIQIGLYEDKGMLEKALETANLAWKEEENTEEKQYWKNEIERLEKLLAEK